MDSITIKILPILEKYGVKKASLFGSYARGTQNETSDIDLLIEPPEGMGITIVRLKRELEVSLNKHVDVISYNGIDRYLKDKILANQVQIL